MKPIKLRAISNFISAAISIGYPALVLSVCFWMLSRSPIAGTIRRIHLSSEHPGVVTLAMGHTTAISFTSKPDRVVVGAPEKLHVDFLGNDVIVTPTGRELGNLLIYTKTGRYVVLFRMGSAANYDDVVEVHEGTVAAQGRPIHLLQESYGIEGIQIVRYRPHRGVEKSQLTAWVSRDGRNLSGDDLAGLIQSTGALHCDGCLIRKRADDRGPSLVCTQAIRTLRCQGADHLQIEIRRGSS